MNFFPAQGNGWPGTNFGNACWGDGYQYDAPGYGGVYNKKNNHLQSHCTNLAQDIQYCQSQGKKVLLSLGGSGTTYQLTGTADGEFFAKFLWNAFGPKTSSWTGPRPFDPLPGTAGPATVVDGFDFDIEHASTGKNAPPNLR